MREPGAEAVINLVMWASLAIIVTSLLLLLLMIINSRSSKEVTIMARDAHITKFITASAPGSLISLHQPQMD